MGRKEARVKQVQVQDRIIRKKKASMLPRAKGLKSVVALGKNHSMVSVSRPRLCAPDSVVLVQ